MRATPRRRLASVPALTAMVATSCVLLAATDTAVSAASARQSHSATYKTPATLSAAAAVRAAADRTLVADAKTLAACLPADHTPPARCNAAVAEVQLAGTKLKAAERHLAAIAGATRQARAAAVDVRRAAPNLIVSGDHLRWNGVAHVRYYLIVRDVPGQASQYAVIGGTSATPPPVPGASVSYSVRTAVSGSAWSRRKWITYPSAPVSNPAEPVSNPTAPSSPPEVIDTQSAPTISVSGEALTWTPVAGVQDYIVASKVAGGTETFTSVSGTSLTPKAVPGATVHYSVRTAVDGSAWSTAVSISYPAPVPVTPPTPTQPTAPEESKAPSSSGIQFGIDGGPNMTLDVGGAVKLGAKVVRVAFPIYATAAQIEPFIAGYAAKGIRVAPLAEFYGTLPTPAEAQNLAGWAKAFGPGGTYWATHGNGQLAIQTIEFGNETSEGYQYDDNAGEPSYQARAETYAVRLKEAAEAITASGIGVGLLACAEDWTGDWMNGMFSTVPNLGNYVAGWISHPYGVGWKVKIEDIINQAKAHGAPSTIPIDITEWGLTTDNGRCLGANSGFNPCMTYAEAAETMRSSVNGIRALLGSRAGLFIFYQVRDQALTGANTNNQDYFGLLQHELQSKGAYTEAAEELLAS